MGYLPLAADGRHDADLLRQAMRYVHARMPKIDASDVEIAEI
jgi:hypothetical protein